MGEFWTHDTLDCLRVAFLFAHWLPLHFSLLLFLLVFYHLCLYGRIALTDTNRNLLAHGGLVNHDIAATLRNSIIGDKHTQGILCWLVEHVDPWYDGQQEGLEKQ